MEENYHTESNSNNENDSFVKKSRKKTKEWMEKGKESIDQIKGNVHNSLEDNENEKFYSAFAYIPIIGPLACFLFKRKQRLTIIHAKNSTYMQLTFLILLFLIWLLNNIPGISHLLKVILFSPIITNAVIYIGIILYLTGSIIGAIRGNEGKVWVVPYLFETMEKFFNSDEKKSERESENE